MRVTAVQLKQHIERAFKLKWKYMSKRKVLDLGIPEALKERNITIVEATEFVKEPVDRKIIIVPEPYNSIRNPPKVVTHRNWNDEMVYHITSSTRLIEGIPQIQVLLKTLVVQGMPEKVEKLKGKLVLEDQDEAVKRKILSCFVQDGLQVRLPKITDHTQPRYVARRTYGIPFSRTVSNLGNGLLHLCTLAKTADSSDRELRTKIPEARVRVFLKKETNKLLLNFTSLYALYGRNELPLFGDALKTENETLPDISPLSPTINIAKTNLYNNKEILDAPLMNTNVPHVIGVIHKTHFHWFSAQKIVRGIASCFAHAAAHAYKLYGPAVRNLPQPICLNGICTDEKRVFLISYQLNTLNLDGSEGLKNQAWIDGPHDLYDTCNKDSGVEGFNPDVWNKILAIYAYGIA